jgi:hypothetical protein
VRTFDLTSIDSAGWEGRWPDKGEHEPCYLCGRPVQVDRPHHRIEIVDGGSHCAIELTDEDRKDRGYMGTYPVGPKCRARIPINFRIRCA